MKYNNECSRKEKYCLLYEHMSTIEAQYIHALRSLENIGDGTIRQFLVHFGSGQATWEASDEDILAVSKVAREKKESLIARRSIIDPIALWNELTLGDIMVHTRDDATYPALLRQIPDYPILLFTRGSYDWNQDRPMISIVGSRKHSSYGEQVAEELARELTSSGYIVVSGMAFGIDSHAHRGALAHGETIAVLGSGIDDRMISPASHFRLAQDIMRQGALLSEYPPGTSANQGSFPMRDRIIAGLSLGTLVIEAPEKSGSLITAECALEYNREVFAIPGSILSPYSIGTNALIKRGAKLVAGISDILAEFPAQASLFPIVADITEGELSVPHDLTPEAKRVLTCLTHEPLHVDMIIRGAKLSAPETSSLLSLLELRGLAKNVGGMHYVRVAS